MDLMLLHITDDPEKVEYSLFNKTDDIATTTKITTLEEAIIEAQKHTAIVLATPGIDVISFEKNLPKMPSNKLLKALPFAIEDQLLEAIDNYHLVITQTQDNGNVSLLAVLRSKMQQWLVPFHNRITFLNMLPDYLCLPYEKDTWHITIEKQVLIRTSKYIGFCCDLESWQQMVTLLWQEQSAETQPKKLIIHQYLLPSAEIDKERVVGQASAIELNIPVLIEQKNATTTLLQDMMKQAYHEKLPVNLLQATFAQEHHLSPVKKVWMFTGSIIASAIIVSLLSTGIQFLMLKRQDNLLQEQITQLYKQVYPQATEVVAPQVRMDRTLKELQANQSGGGYLGLLALTGQVFKQLPAIQITTLRYQDKNLVLEVKANSFNALDLALNKLNQSGVIAKQDQGATKDSQVTARFTIQEKP